jgi:hypothetical protein
MTLMSLHQSANGTKPGPAASVRSGPKVIPLLAGVREKIGDLAGLRALLRQAERTERELTQEILAALERAGLDRLAGREVVAVRGERENIQVDVQLFHEALGAKAYAALSVGVVAARKLMAEDDLRAISTVTVAPVLRLVVIEPAPAAA